MDCLMFIYCRQMIKDMYALHIMQPRYAATFAVRFRCIHGQDTAPASTWCSKISSH